MTERQVRGGEAAIDEAQLTQVLLDGHRIVAQEARRAQLNKQEHQQFLEHHFEKLRGQVIMAGGLVSACSPVSRRNFMEVANQDLLPIRPGKFTVVAAKGNSYGAGGPVLVPQLEAPAGVAVVINYEHLTIFTNERALQAAQVEFDERQLAANQQFVPYLL